jgi:hypothetical protein
VKGQAAAVVSAQWMLDGERLANLNIDRGVGVQPVQTRTIVKHVGLVLDAAGLVRGGTGAAKPDGRLLPVVRNATVWRPEQLREPRGVARPNGTAALHPGRADGSRSAGAGSTRSPITSTDASATPFQLSV